MHSSEHRSSIMCEPKCWRISPSVSETRCMYSEHRSLQMQDACMRMCIYIYVVLFRSTLVHINITSHQHQDATVCVLHPCDCLEIVFIYYLQPDWLKAMQSTNISCENSHWMWESESATTNCCALATAPKVQVSENMWWLHSHYLYSCISFSVSLLISACSTSAAFQSRSSAVFRHLPL